MKFFVTVIGLWMVYLDIGLATKRRIIRPIEVRNVKPKGLNAKVVDTKIKLKVKGKNVTFKLMEKEITLDNFLCSEECSALSGDNQVKEVLQDG